MIIVRDRLMSIQARKERRVLSFGIGAAEDEVFDAGLKERSQAHGAGLEGDVEIAVREAPVVFEPGGLPDGGEFGMGEGILFRFTGVVGSGDDLSRRNNDRANGDFTFSAC